MLLIVQIWDAQNQEVTRRVGATSRRIASKIAEVFTDGKTAKIVPKADATQPDCMRSDQHVLEDPRGAPSCLSALADLRAL